MATTAERGEGLIDEVEAARERLRHTARSALGVTGDENPPPLRETVRRSGVGWYPLLALGLLVVVDQFQGVALAVLGPEISRALGLSRSSFAAIGVLKFIAATMSTLPVAAFVQKRARRAQVAVAAGFGWSMMTGFTGLVTGGWGLVGVQLGDGLTSGSVMTVHTPLLVDCYPPEARVRILSAYRAMDRMGDIAGPLFVAVLTAWLGFTWRGVFLVMGVASILAAFFSVRLRDPGFGRWDTVRVRRAVREEMGATAPAPPEDRPLDLGFFEITRRVLLIPTMRRVYVMNAAIGVMIIPLITYFSFYLEDRWDLGPGERGLFYAAMSVVSIVSVLALSRRGESFQRSDPARLVRTAALLFAANMVLFVLAILAPVFWLMVVLYAVAGVLTASAFIAMSTTLLSIVPPRMRPHASALSGIAISTVGGVGGLLLLAGVDRRYGLVGALVSVSVPGVIACAILYSAGSTVNADLDRMVDDLVDEEEVRTIVAGGGRLPMLACRRIDFSYGQQQVLFDVDFTVDDEEMVALLGTNGAGKSTLLRVIAGLGLPRSGSVRFGGRDITFVDAERRVGLGIVLVPGGRSVFAPLSVVENLRLFGATHGRDTRAVEAGIDAAFDAFPGLAARREQPAATLSGGERQMLGLSKALILRPRLLLIDELSLGLAPKVVSELLDMVRRINAAGSAVVVVEQSVTVALSLVDHAFFMEKGEIRFDGPAPELLARPDLLRSVFLAGAASRLGFDG